MYNKINVNIAQFALSPLSGLKSIPEGVVESDSLSVGDDQNLSISHKLHAARRRVEG